jgi:hypothetical protein
MTFASVTYAWNRLYPFFALSVVGVVIFLAVCFDGEKHFNGISPNDDVTINQKLGNRAYYIMMVVTTVGLCDITAKSVTAKLATSGLLVAQVLQTMQLLRGA